MLRVRQVCAMQCLNVLPSGSDIVSQCSLIVRDAFAANHTDPPPLSVGHHTCMNCCSAERRRLQEQEKINRDYDSVGFSNSINTLLKIHSKNVALNTLAAIYVRQELHY